jgi:hypothetical protein
MLPVDEVKIDSVEVSNIWLGKSIYTKEQLDSCHMGCSYVIVVFCEDLCKSIPEAFRVVFTFTQ